MKTKKIIYKYKNNVAYITLNNPSKLNCMGFQMLNELNDSIAKVEKDNTIKVVVIQGAGERAFSTGADLKEFQTLPNEKQTLWIEFGNEVFNRIENLKKPTIAFINGYAIGGGLELALSCDFRIGTISTIISSPELQHGWLPGWGGMTRLRRLIGEARAKEVVMLCEKISAADALNMGLLNKIENEENEILSKCINHLSALKNSAFILAKMALQNPARSTYGDDIQFDVLAMQIAK
jgi:enoyl-CoA hydratase/carnithine racemase